MARQRRCGGVVDRHAVDRGVDESGRGVGQGGIVCAVDLGLRIGRDRKSAGVMVSVLPVKLIV